MRSLANLLFIFGAPLRLKVFLAFSLFGFQLLPLGQGGHIYLPIIASTSNTKPVIISFAPTNGIEGVEVTLTGQYFTGASEVLFNDIPASEFTVRSDTELVAIVPDGAVGGVISVVTAAGAGESANVFTTSAAVDASSTKPTISSFSPSSGPAGTVVTIKGSNLANVTQVLFNGAPASKITLISKTSLSAVVPAQAMTGRIKVTNNAGTATSSKNFTVVSAPTATPTQSATPTPLPATNTPLPTPTVTPTPTPLPSPTTSPTVTPSATSTATPTPESATDAPTPTQTPTSAALTDTPALPTSTSVPASSMAGIWISAQALAALPTSGTAWTQLKAVADRAAGTPTLRDQSSNTNVNVLAKALVYARTGQPVYRDDVVAALRVITTGATERQGEMLALSRELAAYVISADLIDLKSYDPDLDTQFRAKLRYLLTAPLGTSSSSQTLQITHEKRPNNWGTHAGASRIAVALYLGDKAELDRAATVFHGWLGDYATYHGFQYAELDWQADPTHPVGINPVGATKEGHSIDGALPEEMRRAGAFQWPPVYTDYAWEGLQGAVVQAELLSRAGYPAWDWENKALLRAVQFLYSIGWPAQGDDEWQPWLINHAYGTTYPADPQANPGKNIGWTNWTHAH